jgi:hypothetical protein
VPGWDALISFVRDDVTEPGPELAAEWRERWLVVELELADSTCCSAPAAVVVPPELWVV